MVDSVRNPRARAEAILDGIFSKGVVLVESEGDREEYQAASEALPDYPSREVHFVPVGGTGGFAEPLRFYRSLAIPAAAIADLDAVCDTDNMAAISSILGSNADEVTKAIGQLRDVSQKIKALPCSLTEETAKQELKQLSEQQFDWKRGDDNLLRRRLNELGDQLKRIHRLKAGGIEAYQDQPEIQAGLQGVIDRFARLGLFFVPVGELEDWVKHLMQDCPKGSRSKTERAALAAERIRAAPEKNGDIWAFMRTVLDHLRAREGSSQTA